MSETVLLGLLARQFSVSDSMPGASWTTCVEANNGEELDYLITFFFLKKNTLPKASLRVSTFTVGG
jgi:hypothetical protein